jgi:predicted RNA-binding protein (virulence factor B family)
LDKVDYLGKKVTMTMTDENDRYYFGQLEDGLTFRVAKSEFDQPHVVTDAITGFAYENTEHVLSLTTKMPTVRLNQFGWATVVSSRRDLGVFVSIGLPDKDIVVSLDELPTIHHLWPEKGDQLFVKLAVDVKGRMWGHLADMPEFEARSRRALPTMKNHDITGTIYRLKLVGSYLFTDERNIGFIHPSERDGEPRLGQRIKARVIGVRPDGTMNLSMRPRAYQAISADAEMILAVLQHQPGGVMAYTDKSEPEAIKTFFGISKGQFKRALGHLMKADLIEQREGKTYLKQKN